MIGPDKPAQVSSDAYTLEVKQLTPAPHCYITGLLRPNKPRRSMGTPVMISILAHTDVVVILENVH